LINNRQGGRRRGRGGGPGGGGGRQQGGGPGPGNRQETRNRGNAAQLLEKYKSMARDAQMGGDRVQTEYYLQYAEHYYRLLNENRSRFEEQRPQRGDYYDDDEDQDEGASADGRDARDDGGDDRSYRDDRPARQDRPYREDRDVRADRDDRPYRDDRPARDDRGPRSEPQAQREDSDERRPRPDRPDRDAARNGDAARPRGRPRRDRFEAANEEGEERISLDVLPPAIAAVTSPEAESGDDQPKAPRRRVRRPRDDGDEIAPAA
jgi:hypothetical protein